MGIIIMRFAFVIAAIVALRIDSKAHCTTTGDCTGEGQTCTDNACGFAQKKAKCASTAECGDDQTCTGGACSFHQKKAKCASTAECGGDQVRTGGACGFHQKKAKCSTTGDCSGEGQKCTRGACSF